VGAPNKGKSTFFSAATLVDAQIANYPFTTINPNRGVTYVRSPCPHVALGLPKCDPKNSKCANGQRLVPVNIIDVAGLVPGAHEGKGLGNKFLDNLREADALIQVVDGTGRTDLQGNACDGADPMAEPGFLKDEIAFWLADIMLRGAGKGTAGGVHELSKRLSGLKIDESMLLHAAGECGLDISEGMPDEEGALGLAREVLARRMPIVIAFNKMDAAGAKQNLEHARAGNGAEKIFPCSAAVELALRKAADRNIINYTPGAKSFEIVGSPDERQAEALVKMKVFLEQGGGSGVQEIIDWIVYQKLGGIIVYPVEDEHKLTDHEGNVLPDAYLVRRGSTARDLAYKVHTDLGENFIRAINVRTQRAVGHDHVLEDGDIMTIVSRR